nr:MAG TPA: hypothetical protein [Caudoviricetes sp.]DAX30955.1 MAG TPA: hypothetical protein [Caudoviricetes sp.]
MQLPSSRKTRKNTYYCKTMTDDFSNTRILKCK